MNFSEQYSVYCGVYELQPSVQYYFCVWPPVYCAVHPLRLSVAALCLAVLHCELKSSPPASAFWHTHTSAHPCLHTFESDVAVFVLTRDVKLQPTNQPYAHASADSSISLPWTARVTYGEAVTNIPHCTKNHGGRWRNMKSQATLYGTSDEHQYQDQGLRANVNYSGRKSIFLDLITCRNGTKTYESHRVVRLLMSKAICAAVTVSKRTKQQQQNL